MSIKRGELNPLGILNLRKLDWIPEHFTRVIIDHQFIDIRLLEQWIEYNLNSRYGIRKIMSVNSVKKLVDCLEIGIEDSKEVSMLMLSCPLITTRTI